jgi:hypothetical protein
MKTIGTEGLGSHLDSVCPNGSGAVAMSAAQLRRPARPKRGRDICVAGEEEMT